MGGLQPYQFEVTRLSLIEPYLYAGTITPVICCGMVGARQGWAEVPYGNVPAAPPDAMGALWVTGIDPRIDVRILSGVAQSRPADVMHGEETQI